MKALSLSAGVLAAALAIAAMPAAAADLDYGYVPPPDRYGSAYDDPRYRDLYGPEPAPPRVYSYAPRPVEPRYYDPPPPGPVPPGYVYGDRYAERPPGDDWRYADGCVPRREIKRRLVEDGWSEFHDLDARGTVARIKARRANGDLFTLKVDRCTGDILRADLLERHGIGPYADRGGPPPYGRRYTY
ncbi:MAG: hypothetical protein SFW09_24085 [Hyphomicrobiaceae bacterium]|nr:hypothetical protein [Hyphomicrobiaceae bacterium]